MPLVIFLAVLLAAAPAGAQEKIDTAMVAASLRREQMATRAPSSTNNFATAFPKPRLAAATSAVWPRRPKSINNLGGGGRFPPPSDTSPSPNPDTAQRHVMLGLGKAGPAHGTNLGPMYPNTARGALATCLPYCRSWHLRTVRPARTGATARPVHRGAGSPAR